MTDHFSMTFSPQRPCFNCERLTNWGIAEQEEDSRYFTVSPSCWQHGYFEFDQVREQYECVSRFVLGHHHGVGTVTVIGPCSPEDVPGWAHQPCARFSPYAWQVRYEGEGKRIYGYVIYSVDELAFAWYSPTNVQEEKEEQ